MIRLRQSAALISVYVFYAVLLNSVGVVILQSILTFGIAKSTGAVLEGCKDLSIAVVSFAVASLLPRLGYRNALVLAVGAVSLACLAMPLLPSFPTAALLFLAIGVTFAVVKVVVYSTIGLLNTEPKGHASFTSLVEGCFMVGVLSGAWIFSLFIDPAHPGSLAWLRVYWLLPALGAVVMLLWLTTPMPESAAAAAGRRTSLTESLGESLRGMAAVWTLPVIPACLAAIFLYVLVEQSLGTWLPTYNREILHLPAAVSVQTGSLLAAAIAVGRLAGGVVLRRIAWAPLLLSYLGAVAAIILLALWPVAKGSLHPAGWGDAPWQTFILPLAGIFLAPIYPTIISAVLSTLPERRHAPMMGLIIAFSALGGTFGSFLTGQLFGRFGGREAFAMSLVPTALLAVSLVLLRRRLASGGETVDESRTFRA